MFSATPLTPARGAPYPASRPLQARERGPRIDVVEVVGAGQRGGQRPGVDDGQRARRARERRVEAAGAAVGALVQDLRGLDDDRAVELEPLDRTKADHIDAARK